MTTALLDETQKNFNTTQGDVGLPILYHDASVLQAFFFVSGEKAAGFLRGTGLRPMVTAGRALAGLVFFEYRDTSIGPYNEAGLALACYLEDEPKQPNVLQDFLRPSEARKMGFYVVDLPVTTDIACAAGKEIWGLPKFVTDIKFDFDGRRFTGVIESPRAKNPICTLTGKLPIGIRLPAIDMVLYSPRKSKLLKTVVKTSAAMKNTAGQGLTLRVGASKHRMAKNLRNLGLDGASPFAVQASNRILSRLPAGRPLQRVPAETR